MDSEHQIKLFNSTIVKQWLVNNPPTLTTFDINNWLIKNKYKHRYGATLGSEEPDEYAKNGRRYRFRQSEAKLWHTNKERFITDLINKRNYGDFSESDAADLYKALPYYSGPCPFKYDEWTVDISDSNFDRWANSVEVTITANQFIKAIDSKGYLYEMTLFKNKNEKILKCFI